MFRSAHIRSQEKEQFMENGRRNVCLKPDKVSEKRNKDFRENGIETDKLEQRQKARGVWKVMFPCLLFFCGLKDKWMIIYKRNVRDMCGDGLWVLNEILI